MITVQMSREEIQKQLDAGGEVTFAPGVYEEAHYRLSKPTHIKGDGAIFVGGRRIFWREEEGLLVCDVEGDLPLRSLVVKGGLRGRCRLPKEGYWKHESVFDVKWMSTTGGGWQRKPTHEELSTLKAAPGTLASLDLSSAEATIKHSWDESLLTVEKVEGDRITFAQEGGHPAGGFGVKDYCLWNVPQGFTEAGTFYHDKGAGKLYYRPLEGESVSTEAWLPTQESIFYSEEPVSGIEIEEVTLLVTDTPRIAAGFGAYAMTGAIDLPEVEDSTIHHVKISATGGYGIRVKNRAENLRVHHCGIFNTGAGGIRLGGEKNAIPVERYNEVADCRVEQVGLYYASAIGISTVHCHVRHNEVGYCSYSGINSGGDHLCIENNIIHHAMMVLDDGAAFYSFGSHDGVLRGNLVYGILPRVGHNQRSAYYLDELAKDWLVEHNVALDCPVANHNHMCGDHLYRNNFFVNREGDMLLSMHNPASGNIYEGNVIMAAGELTLSTSEKGVAAFRGNLYHSASGKIRWRYLEKYEFIENREFAVEESNRLFPIPQVSPEQRIFRLETITVDITGVGVRQG